MWTTIATHAKQVLGSLAILLIAAFIIININQAVPYDQLPDTGPLGLVLVKETATTGEKNVVYRLKDGLPQTIVGNWRHEFSLPHEIFFYGFSPEQPNNQIIMALNDIRANVKKPSDLPGIVENIKASPDSNYLMISGRDGKEGTSYTCIISRRKSSFSSCVHIPQDILTEEQYKDVSEHVSFWDKEGSNLIVLGSSPERPAYIYQTASSTAITIEEESQKQEIEDQLNTLLEDPNPMHESWVFGPIVLVKDKRDNDYSFFLEFGVKDIHPVSSQHFLMQKEDDIWVLHANKRKKSRLGTISKDKTIEIDYYAKNRR